MRILWAIVFIFCIEANIFGQTDSITVYSYQLPQPQYTQWQNIYNDWFKTEYPQFLKQFNITMNCGNCISVFIEVDFVTDSMAQIVDYKIVKEKICSQKATDSMKNFMLRFFIQKQLPIEFKNLRFRARLGTGLKC